MQYTAENLRFPIARQEFAALVKTKLDAHIVEKYSRNEQSRRMGASEVAHKCAAYLWYKFRWATPRTYSARELRLFDRGNREEARFVEWLRGIGFEVWDVDPFAHDNAKNKQFRVKVCRDHVGGFVDSLGSGNLCDVPLLFEYKTYSTKTFEQLVSQGVEMYRPQHYGQMCIYGEDYSLDFGLYFAINKNDDDWHVECVELKKPRAQHLRYRAEAIINLKTRPERLSESATYWECKGCDYNGICHGLEKFPVSCRSCIHATPVEKAEWRCDHFNQIIPYDFIPKGCEQHKAVK